jgi:hypothetical protein
MGHFCSRCGIPLAVGNESGYCSEHGDTIRCPFCKEHILAGAIKCRYCGEFLTPQKMAAGYSASGSPVKHRSAFPWKSVLISILGLIVLFEVNGIYVSNEEHKTAQQKQEQAESFSRMSPAQHLSAAKELLQSLGSDSENSAVEHLRAIPLSAPEHSQVRGVMLLVATRTHQRLANEAKEGAQAQESSNALLAPIRCENAVTTTLKAPSTAKFAPYSGAQVMDLGEGKYVVRSYVDAENSFGAHIRTPYTCTVQCVAVEACSVTQLVQ